MASDPGARADKLKRAGDAASEQTRDKPVGSSVQSCPGEEETTWIELELKGEDGVGVPDMEYLVVTKEGKELRGKTDASGLARLEGIAQGDCTIGFPKLDRDTWDRK